MYSYEIEKQQEVEGVARSAMTGVLAALKTSKRNVIIENLHIQINYASGGGARVEIRNG